MCKTCADEEQQRRGAARQPAPSGRSRPGTCAEAQTPRRATPSRLPDCSAHHFSVVFMKMLLHSTTHPGQFIFSFALSGRSLRKWNRSGLAVPFRDCRLLQPRLFGAVRVTRSWRVQPECTFLTCCEVSAPSRFLFPFSGLAFPLAFGKQLGSQIPQISCHCSFQAVNSYGRSPRIRLDFPDGRDTGPARFWRPSRGCTSWVSPEMVSS